MAIGRHTAHNPPIPGKQEGFASRMIEISKHATDGAEEQRLESYTSLVVLAAVTVVGVEGALAIQCSFARV